MHVILVEDSLFAEALHGHCGDLYMRDGRFSQLRLHQLRRELLLDLKGPFVWNVASAEVFSTQSMELLNSLSPFILADLRGGYFAVTVRLLTRYLITGHGRFTTTVLDSVGSTLSQLIVH